MLGAGRLAVLDISDNCAGLQPRWIEQQACDGTLQSLERLRHQFRSRSKLALNLQTVCRLN